MIASGMSPGWESCKRPLPRIPRICTNSDKRAPPFEFVQIRGIRGRCFADTPSTFITLTFWSRGGRLGSYDQGTVLHDCPAECWV